MAVFGPAFIILRDFNTKFTLSPEYTVLNWGYEHQVCNLGVVEDVTQVLGQGKDGKRKAT